jgi:hypothetical protein
MNIYPDNVDPFFRESKSENVEFYPGERGEERYFLDFS